jgi:mitochondrial distribution and morphology protein 10
VPEVVPPPPSPCRTKTENADLTYVLVVSTGIRFTTLPDAAAPSFHPGPPPLSKSSTLPSPSHTALSSSSSSSSIFEPPTTITALFNPMMGHMSGAYTAQVSKDLSLSTRFDFNVYSYESEWAMGAEWWLRRSRSSKPVSSDDDGTIDNAASAVAVLPSFSFSEATPPPAAQCDDITGVVKARASTSNVRSFPSLTRMISKIEDRFLFSHTQDIALLWEGRLKNVLIGLGVASNLSSGTKPIKSFGLELSYFSSG